jgi:hypothetical protein
MGDSVGNDQIIISRRPESPVPDVHNVHDVAELTQHGSNLLTLSGILMTEKPRVTVFQQERLDHVDEERALGRARLISRVGIIDDGKMSCSPLYNVFEFVQQTERRRLDHFMLLRTKR